MLPSSHNFNDLRSKLIFYEQRLMFQSNRDAPVHQALVNTISYDNSNSRGGYRHQKCNSNCTKNGGRRNWNNQGHNNKGGAKNSLNNNNSQQHNSSSWSMTTGIAYGISNVLLSSTFCASTMDTHSLSAGTNQSDGILGSHPNVICQICNAPGDYDDTCPSRYQPRHQPCVLHMLPSIPSMLVNNFGILTLLLPPPWLPTMVSYTPNLFTLAPVLLKLGMELCYPLSILVKVMPLLLLSHCVSITSFISLTCAITFEPLGSFVMTTTAVWSLILISFVLRKTPRWGPFAGP